VITEAADRLIVALDVATGEEARALVRATEASARRYKVGSQLFTSEGPELVRELAGAGFGVFLDLKFHDIPNTVAEASRAAAGLGVEMFNVHASGGHEMMTAAVEASREGAAAAGHTPPKVLGVTVLTSLPGMIEEVLDLAGKAREAGADGVVASAREAPAIRAAMGSDFLIVTPGIRPASSATDDQRRVTTPAEAVAGGADLIVVGRPIRAAADPGLAARAIVAEMERGEERREGHAR